MEANKVDLDKLHLVKMWFKIYGRMTNPELRELGVEYPYSYITRLIHEGMTIESKVSNKSGNPYWVYLVK